MHRNAKSHAARGPQYRLLYAALAGLTFLVAGWTSISLAATDLSLDCDKTARHLHDLDVDPLAVEAVDLADVNEASNSSADDLTESVAPVLFLTPRVASILEDVFGDAIRPQPDAASETKTAAPASSPVVGTTGTQELEAPEPAPMYENAAILPRFQRRMYRTDI